MRIFRELRKRWAIRGYVRRLPKLLRGDYGASRSYTPAQIRASIARYGLNLDYSCYALAIYADQNAFTQFHAALGQACDYLAMRAEIAADHFNGDIHCIVPDMLQAVPDTGHHADGGGWHSGADGHGHSGSGP